MSEKSQRIAAGIGLAALLFGVYVLVYRGSFTGSPDEYRLFDSTESFVTRGNFNITYMYHSEYDGERIALAQGYPIDLSVNPAYQRIQSGEAPFRTSWYEPLHSILGAPFFWLGQQSDAIGQINAVYFVNPFVTVITAVTLYGLALRRGYGLVTALGLGLLYGLATNALPFAQYNVREPITALFVLVAFFFALEYADEPAWWRLVAMAAALGVAMLAKVAVIMVVPGLIVIIAAEPRQLLQNRRALAAGAAVLVMGVLFILWLSTVEGASDRLNLGIITGALEPSRLRYAFEALLFYQVGWGRGIWFFNPILLLGFVSAYLGWQRGDIRLSLAIALTLVAISMGYGLIQTVHWTGGTLGYGPRYISILYPVMVLWTAPALVAVVNEGGRALKVGLAGLAGVSGLMQAIGTLYQSTRYFERISTVEFPPWALEAHPPLTLSQPATHIAFLLEGIRPDIAWLDRASPGWVMPLAALVLVAFGALVMVQSVQNWGRFKGAQRVVYPAFGVLVAVGFVGTLVSLRDDPKPVVASDARRAIVERIEADAQPEDMIVLLYADYYEPFMNELDTGQLTIGVQSSFPLDEGEPIDQPLDMPRLRRLVGPGSLTSLRWAATATERVWLVGEPGTEQPAIRRPVAFFLSHTYYPVTRVVVEEGTQAGLYYMALAPEGDPGQAADITFGEGLRLVGYDLPTTEARAGEVLPLSLVWVLSEPLTEDYDVRVALRDEAGAVTVLREGSPQGGFGQTSAWEVGERYRDNHGLQIPPGLPAGGYTLEVSVYDAQGALQPPVELTTISVD